MLIITNIINKINKTHAINQIDTRQSDINNNGNTEDCRGKIGRFRRQENNELWK